MIFVGCATLKYEADIFDLSHDSSAWTDCRSRRLLRVNRKNFTSPSGHGRSTIQEHGPMSICDRASRGPSINVGRTFATATCTWWNTWTNSSADKLNWTRKFESTTKLLTQNEISDGWVNVAVSPNLHCCGILHHPPQNYSRKWFCISLVVMRKFARKWLAHRRKQFFFTTAKWNEY